MADQPLLAVQDVVAVGVLDGGGVQVGARAAGLLGDGEVAVHRFVLELVHQLGLDLVGAVIVTWKIQDPSRYRIRWVALKTFTGMQLKYIMPKKFPPLVFALAAEDAFAYCNKIPCEECAFRCKSGFELYALIEGIGIVKRSMDRISMLNLDKIK